MQEGAAGGKAAIIYAGSGKPSKKVMPQDVAVRDTSAQEAAPKKPSKKRTIISLSIISVTAIGLGLGAGFFLHNQIAGGTLADYNNVNATDYVDDNTNLLNEYAKVKKAGGDYLSAYQKEPYKVANIAYGLYSKETHLFAQGIGSGTAKMFGMAIVQQIRSTVIRDNDNYFEESCSCSKVVNLADRMYQSGDSVVRNEGKVKDSNAEIPESFTKATTYTLPEYRQAMGRLLSDPCIYLISSKTTFLDETATSGVKTSFSKNESGYALELELDPAHSVINYVRQMQTISSLVSPPAFTYVHLSLSLDKDLNPLAMETHEYYYAAVSTAAGSYVEGRLRTVYQSGGNYTIPELNNPVTYREKM